jgi:outer membrane protein OmpA-like peptidoglycan-associated protein
MRSTIFHSAVLVIVMVGCLSLTAFAAGAPDLLIQAAKPGAAVEITQVIEDGKVVVNVVDAEKKPLFGLGAADFSVSRPNRTGKIISAEPIAQNTDVPRHIVLVLDNSYSMRQNDAVDGLLGSLNEILKTIRPIDDVQIVSLTGWKTKTMGGRKLRVNTFGSNIPAELQLFAEKAYHGGTTITTNLYEGMLAGLELIRAMPEKGPRFMLVFTDGEDLNSIYTRNDVLEAAKGAGPFNAFVIDYMPGPKTDTFLTSFAESNHGQIFKAGSKTKLYPIFESVASKQSYHYVISYEFPLAEKPAVAPKGLTIEEVRTIDSSPMLGNVYFDEGSSTIPSHYARFAAPAETEGFDEQKFGNTMDKYSQVLNIIGKRLTDKPGDKITLVGCISDTGKEKGRKKLSTLRAEAVRNYLHKVWNISPDRMKVESRGLPAMPSAKWLAAGQEENRRVEIRSSDPALVAPVRSVYLAMRIDASELKVNPNVIEPVDVSSWRMTAVNTTGKLAEQEGNGSPAPELTLALPANDLKALAAGGDVTVSVALKGTKGQSQELSAEPVKVSFVETSERLAHKQDLKVQEKYALLLFDFNKDTVSSLNKAIIDRVAERIKAMPGATARIVGHTDNTGKEAYNVKLSERRAQAVYKLLSDACGKDAATRISQAGVGPKEPLYVNTTPEGRAFNRTVTITLEYMSAE